MRVQGLCLLLVLGCAGCELFGVDGNGHRATEQRDVGEFDRVDSRGSFEIEIERGDEFSVSVRIDSNLIDSVTTRVVGGELRIDSNEPIGDILPGPHVLITMPQLTAATLSGSGVVAVVDFEQDRDLSLRLSGSGRMDFAGNVPGLAAHLSGSGEIVLVGEAIDLLLDMSGSGSLDARELHAMAATLDLSGSGDIRATVDGPVEIDLDGSGDIELFGDHSIERISKRGSGDLHKH